MPRGTLATDPAAPNRPAARPAWWEPRARLRPAGSETLAAPASPLPGAVSAPATVTIAEVLRLWRAAERQVEATDVGSPAHESALADVAELRAHYQRLFAARR